MTDAPKATRSDPDEGYVPAYVARPPWRRPITVREREVELEKARDADERRVDVSLGGAHIQAVRYD